MSVENWDLGELRARLRAGHLVTANPDQMVDVGIGRPVDASTAALAVVRHINGLGVDSTSRDIEASRLIHAALRGAA